MAPETAVPEVTRGIAHPVLLVCEGIFSAVFAGLFSVIVSRNIFSGAMSSFLMAASLVAGFIIMFAGIHYGKVLRK
jgi:ABC-type multidrug transport system permease subunit